MNKHSLIFKPISILTLIVSVSILSGCFSKPTGTSTSQISSDSFAGSGYQSNDETSSGISDDSGVNSGTGSTSQNGTNSANSALSAPSSRNASSSTNKATPIPTVQPTTDIVIKSVLKVGDYVEMGRYYGKPVLWRCVFTDANGLLMLSDRILTMKAFDSGGVNLYPDKTIQKEDVAKTRTAYGSNIWETSTLRTWLNSEAQAEKVDWAYGTPPFKEFLKDGKNPYANEKGFLALDNFTKGELKIIKSVSQKSLLPQIDYIKLSTGGSEPLINKGDSPTPRNEPNMQNLPDVIQNYNKAYFHDVTDKMFVLDIVQINKVAQNSQILGADYYIGKPTQQMIDNSQHDITPFLAVNKFWYNWLRTPVCDYNISKVYLLSFKSPYHEKGIYYENANYFYVGVRPAFYINLLPNVFVSGNGTINSPYVVRHNY